MLASNYNLRRGRSVPLGRGDSLHPGCTDSCSRHRKIGTRSPVQRSYPIRGMTGEHVSVLHFDRKRRRRRFTPRVRVRLSSEGPAPEPEAV